MHIEVKVKVLQLGQLAHHPLVAQVLVLEVEDDAVGLELLGRLRTRAHLWLDRGSSVIVNIDEQRIGVSFLFEELLGGSLLHGAAFSDDLGVVSPNARGILAQAEHVCHFLGLGEVSCEPLRLAQLHRRVIVITLLRDHPASTRTSLCAI